MSARRKTPVLIALALLLAGGPGCEARLTLGARCARTSECTEPLVCGVGGRCLEACASSRDCPFGLHCVRDPAAADLASALRTCLLDGDACTAGSCVTGLVCLDGRCVNQCALGDECPDGLCQAGACPPMVSGRDAGEPVDADAARDASADARSDTGEETDAGSDARMDGGPDVGIDGGDSIDSGVLDAGALDAGAAMDAGSDAAAPGLDGGASAAGVEATLVAATPMTNDYAGWSVALSADGTRALVGQSAGLLPSGTVTVLVRSGTTWTIEATLAAATGLAGDRFGVSVALSADGGLALVGAEQDDVGSVVDAGSATVFLRTGTTWAEETTLVASSGSNGDRFGAAVALAADGSRALVGSPQDGRPGRLGHGTATVFLRTGATWTEEMVLTVSDAASNDNLGTSVALSADASRALVGVGADDVGTAMDAGSARVFSRSGTTWTAEATLVATGGAASDYMGYSVALSADGGRALVGVHGDDTTAGGSAGSVRFFTRTGTTWLEQATLVARDAAPLDTFGRAVALDATGSRAIVGVPSDDTIDGLDAGSARFFTLSGTTWTEQATLRASTAITNDQLGISAALASDGARALVGAHLDDVGAAADAGSATVFVLP